MKSKQLLLTAFVLALFLVSSVSAATTLVAPITGATVGGLNVVLNVTSTDVLNPGSALLNVTFYAQSTLTANSTWARIGQVLNFNTTALNNTFTRFNTTTIEDASNYQFNVTIANSTGVFATTVNTGITVDSGVPTTPTLTSPTNNNINTSKGTTTFSADVNDASTTACTYSIGRGGTSSTSQDTISGDGTYSVGTCTFTRAFSTSSSNGDWHWIIIASDGTNTTSSNPFVYSVQIAGS